MSEDGVYHCPYPDCDWEIEHPPDVPLSIVVYRVDVQQHRKAHREDTVDEGIHYHQCGYCGRQFRPAYDNLNPEQPCPQCRSRKKECDCCV